MQHSQDKYLEQIETEILTIENIGFDEDLDDF